MPGVVISVKSQWEGGFYIVLWIIRKVINYNYKKTLILLSVMRIVIKHFIPSTATYTLFSTLSPVWFIELQWFFPRYSLLSLSSLAWLSSTLLSHCKSLFNFSSHTHLFHHLLLLPYSSIKSTIIISMNVSSWLISPFLFPDCAFNYSYPLMNSYKFPISRFSDSIYYMLRTTYSFCST